MLIAVPFTWILTSAAIAVDSHLTVAVAGRKRAAGDPLSAAVSAGPSSSSKFKQSHIVHWTLEDGNFIYPLNGVMAGPHPEFSSAFKRSLL